MKKIEECPRKDMPDRFIGPPLARLRDLFPHVRKRECPPTKKYGVAGKRTRLSARGNRDAYKKQFHIFTATIKKSAEKKRVPTKEEVYSLRNVKEA